MCRLRLTWVIGMSETRSDLRSMPGALNEIEIG